MLTLKTTSKFRKDYKRMKKQGKNMSLLKIIINDLLAEEILDPNYHDHPLSGNYAGFRECHILPDWLLIYAIDYDQLLLTVSRTGTHSDLFNE